MALVTPMVSSPELPWDSDAGGGAEQAGASTLLWLSGRVLTASVWQSPSPRGAGQALSSLLPPPLRSLWSPIEGLTPLVGVFIC